MSANATVAIHSSQFPENVRRDLLQSLRSRRMAHKFHYDSVKQTQKWLALHQHYSPSRNDESCRAAYDESFKAAAGEMAPGPVHVIGLGCGGGQKDTRLIKILKSRNRELFYTPCDVAVAMVLTARHAARAVLAEDHCFPLVCDLQTAEDLPATFEFPAARGARRVLSFFGMMPNFEPLQILPKLASLVRFRDILLLSANLAPGSSNADNVRNILPQYDNTHTRDWLLTVLLDLGIEKNDGDLQFEIEAKNSLRRIAARFQFRRNRRIEIGDERFSFKSGQKIRLFFSYRYTPELIQKLLARHRLNLRGQWIAESGEEGVFLCRRS